MDSFPDFKKDKQGRIINNNQKVCAIGALILQYRMLDEYQKVNALTDQLTNDEKYKFLEACLGTAKSLAFNLYLEVQATQRSNQELGEDIDLLIIKLAERDKALKTFGVDMTIDKRKNA